MIVIDSGLGGISVVRALRATHPNLPLIYLADTAGFPYGKRSAEDICARAIAMVEQLNQRHPGAPIVIACNTLSTLCLDLLRGTFSNAFVGTVPAVKTAAQISKTRRFTLLATPNTAHSRYSSDLISEFAGDCVVDCYGAPGLASMAESILLGTPPDLQALRNEIAPAFENDALGKTDAIVLGCTHYPLIVDQLRAVAPWEVTYIDSSEAIARRALSLSEQVPLPSIAYVTNDQHIEAYRTVFQREGFEDVQSFNVVKNVLA